MNPIMLRPVSKHFPLLPLTMAFIMMHDLLNKIIPHQGNFLWQIPPLMIMGLLIFFLPLAKPSVFVHRYLETGPKGLSIIFLICIGILILPAYTKILNPLYSAILLILIAAAKVGGSYKPLLAVIAIAGILYSISGTILPLAIITLGFTRKGHCKTELDIEEHEPTENPVRTLNSPGFWDGIAKDFSAHVHPKTLSVLRAILMTQEMRDSFAVGHSIRVMRIAEQISQKMDLSEGVQKEIRLACLFHDIGKIEIDQAILQKREPLDALEYQWIMQHPRKSVIILEKFGVHDKMSHFIHHHHERYDGKGYPQHLCQSEIPLGARIISIADAIDAMASARVYGYRKSTEQIVAELADGMSSQFDPSICRFAIDTIVKTPLFAALGYFKES